MITFKVNVRVIRAREYQFAGKNRETGEKTGEMIKAKEIVLQVIDGGDLMRVSGTKETDMTILEEFQKTGDPCEATFRVLMDFADKPKVALLTVE